jgi:hypothetical protein
LFGGLFIVAPLKFSSSANVSAFTSLGLRVKGINEIASFHRQQALTYATSKQIPLLIVVFIPSYSQPLAVLHVKYS